MPLVANEVEYSLVNREAEDEVAGAASALGLGPAAWSPLGRGVLTGKYRHGMPADSRAASPRLRGASPRATWTTTRAQVVDALAIAARGLGVSAAEVALAWVRDRPGVVAPIVGARTTAQLRTRAGREELELPGRAGAALDEVSD